MPKNREREIPIIKLVMAPTVLASGISESALRLKIERQAKRTMMKQNGSYAGVYPVRLYEFREQPPHQLVRRYTLRDGSLEGEQ